jgi:tRNA uridine 5-carboxymethylaminomethyl modification enzyme
LAERLGLLTDDERRTAAKKLRHEEQIRDLALQTSLSPSIANEILREATSAPISEPQRITDLAKRPGVALHDLLRVSGMEVNVEMAEWAEIELKYAGYLERERLSAARMSSMEDFILPEGTDYRAITSLSFEAREKLTAIKPRSLGHAKRIPGVSPSDIQNLVIAVMKLRGPKNKTSCFT